MDKENKKYTRGRYSYSIGLYAPAYNVEQTKTYMDESDRTKNKERERHKDDSRRYELYSKPQNR